MSNERFTSEPRTGSTPSSNVTPEERKIQSEARARIDEARAEAESRLRSAADERKHVAAENIDAVAQALRRTAQQLESERQMPAARYLDWAADGLERMSSGLRDKDLRSVIRQTEDFAREQPVLFFGGAVTTGFLLTRFLKSSTAGESVRRAPEPAPRPPEI